MGNRHNQRQSPPRRGRRVTSHESRVTHEDRRVASGGWPVAIVVALLAGLFLTSCTDTDLYSESRLRSAADRMAFQGRVCTEDPGRAAFPTRVVLLVDQSKGPQYASGGDNISFAQKRTRVLNEFVRNTLREEKTKVALVGYGGRPRKLVPTEGNFTGNPAKALGGIQTLAQSEGCTDAGFCRDYRGAIDLAQTLIEGDMASLPTGLRVMTQYVVVMVNAGPQSKATHPNGCCALENSGSTCCPGYDPQDPNSSADPSCKRIWQCQHQTDQQRITRLRDKVEEDNGAGLRFHSIHLSATGEINRGGMGSTKTVEITDKDHERLESTMKQMAVVGGGTYQRLNAPGGLDKSTFDLLDLGTTLHAKQLLAVNHNAYPTPSGPVVDSDADGLPDRRESEMETSPIKSDTDADGISDRVELLVGFDPTAPNDPDVCSEFDPRDDADLDGLTDCDETLLGTERTLVDSDGDAVSDRIELFAGTDYLNHDADVDTDGDGVPNGTELQQRTDPRSTDVDQHLPYAYRYDIEDQGFITDLFATDPEKITGVKIVDLTAGSTPGLGTLRYDPGSSTLKWRDALDDRFGKPVEVDQPGTYELPSNSYSPVQGDDGRKISVEVSPEALPPDPVTESIRVTSRTRQCLDYQISNIKLMATQKLADGTPAGRNDITLYFSQAPEGDLLQPGPFRRAQIPVDFDPPNERRPAAPIVDVANREYVRPELRLGQ